ncbi:MAG: ATP-binding cassette domain-containing protein [Actinobacteria bacterium]|nr:ATP-binding cassette domain-containing protein [Actinomycetota bacterium]
MIIVKDLSVEAGIRRLVDAATFALHPGDKVGLVGSNGAGKSTLLRTLAGRLEPVEGVIARSGSIGYLSQEAALPELDHPLATALERVLAAREIGAVQQAMEDTRRKMETAESAVREQLIGRFSRLEADFEVRGGYRAEAEARRVAASVGLGDAELAQPIVTMSGGQRRRVELARILFAETDTLLLDEPTNHLDLDAKGWLCRYLAEYSGALLVISHDLPLLDESITSVLALEQGRLEPYRGNYGHYLAERQRRRELRIRERRIQDLKITQLEDNVRRFKGGSEKLARRAKSMQTRADRIKGQLVDVGSVGRRVAMQFPQPEPSGRIPLQAAGLAKAFGDNVVFVDVDVHVERGERVLIIGLNGAGKTTLLRVLAGQEPADLGEVEVGHRVSLGYYAQEHESIDPDATVLEHMRMASTEPDRMLRAVLGHFLLADKIDQHAGTLSGGEKTKLALAQLVVGRHNVLLLDEPTNNLDPQAKEALLGAIRVYQGTVVMVSHDTDFVGALMPDRAVLMPEGQVTFFDESLLDLVALA